MVKLSDFFPPELKSQGTILSPPPSKLYKHLKSNNNLSENNPTKSHSYAYPHRRKLPLDTSRQVESAITYFDKVVGVSDLDKVEAFKRIIEKAEIFKVCTIVFKTKYPSYFQSMK
jgi:hypothetical protein